MTTRRIIEKLQSLDVIETCCWDGSRLLRLVPVDEEQAALWQCLAHILAEFRFPRGPYPLPPADETPPLALPPPREWPLAA